MVDDLIPWTSVIQQ